MLNRLGVAGILSESGVVLPFFPQDDSALWSRSTSHAPKMTSWSS
ncbi:hypothetical protein [Enterobacter roggenkampii]